MSPDQIASFIALFKKGLSIVATIDDLTDLRERLSEAESRVGLLETLNTDLRKKLEQGQRPG